MSKYTDQELLSMLELCEEKYGKVTTSLVDSDDGFCHSSIIKSRFGSFSRAKQIAELDDVGQIHFTDDERKKISNNLTDKQKDILRGLVMGDAWVESKNNGGTGRLSVEMKNKEFLDWVSNKIPNVVSDVSMRSSAGELVAKNREYGYAVVEENYNDMYVLRTHSLSFIGELYNWYDSGVKRFPENIDLSPTVLNIWYCCDGSFVQSEYPVIYSSNESDRRDVILSLFDSVPVNPSFNDGGGGVIQIRREESDNFFDYIGSPPDEFGYKWPDQNC